MVLLWRFQSTLSWGERLGINFFIIPPYDFNPRSPGESDLCEGSHSPRHLNFNPRSPGESDDFSLTEIRILCNFNPRSPGESDYGPVQVIDLAQDFNPRSPGESDVLTPPTLPGNTKFQSTLSWGERRKTVS